MSLHTSMDQDGGQPENDNLKTFSGIKSSQFDTVFTECYLTGYYWRQVSIGLASGLALIELLAII